MISDHKIRKLPQDLRKEVFRYIPKHRLTGMSWQTLFVILHAYGREDLYYEVGRALPEKSQKRSEIPQKRP